VTTTFIIKEKSKVTYKNLVHPQGRSVENTR